MRYLNRKDVMSRLRLSQAGSYRIIGTARSPLIAASDVLAILNNSRRGPQPLLLEIPDDILTGEEMAAALECVTPKQIHNWTLRTRNPLPHFLLNTHCRRFQRSAVIAWLDHLSQIVRRG